jgi:hypothetical protein
MPFFRKSEMRTECDACDYRFDLTHGGVCARCKRILCYRHLHGSWVHRIVSDVSGRETICVDCRRGREPSPTR